MGKSLTEKLKEKGNDQMGAMAILMKGGKLLLGLRNYTPDKYKLISVWTTPGGRCGNGETFEKTLRREVGEETGIADFEIIDFLGEVPGMKGSDAVVLFLCRTKQEPELLEPEKFSEWRWMKPAEIPENFINPSVLEIIHNLPFGKTN